MEENIKKTTKKKKLIIFLVIVLAIFLGVNAYAASMGKNNIFFVIKELFKPTTIEVNNPEDILSDKDITISYKSIEIAEGLKVQINRLTIEEDKATLFMKIDTTGASVLPDYCMVNDMTNGKEIGKTLASEKISIPKTETKFDTQIKLKGMEKNTKLLEIDFRDKKDSSIAVLELDLEQKIINVISSRQKELEKISEVELKSVLENYVRMHIYEDMEVMATQYHTVSDYRNEEKVLIALEYLEDEKRPFPTVEISVVHDVIKEFTGEDIKDNKPLNLSNILVTYDSHNNAYKYIAKKRARKALCLDITDINYSDGVYKVSFIYCYPEEEDYKNDNIENLQKYKGTMNLKINSNYEYAKYCIVDGDKFITEKYGEISNENNNSNNNTISNTTTNTSTNTVYTETSNNTATSVNNTNTVSETNIQPGTELANNIPANVDNYASTMKWKDISLPGLKTKIPEEWNLEVYKNIYWGPEDDGTVAARATGIATGINKETNQIVKSNVEITYYMPEFVDCRTTEEYSSMVASRHGTWFGKTGYGSGYDGLTWGDVTPRNERPIMNTYYCHFEPTDNGNHGVGFIIQVYTDNCENLKVTNILNWIFGDVKMTSF